MENSARSSEKVVQFAFSIDKEGGRERFMENIYDETGIPVKVLGLGRTGIEQFQYTTVEELEEVVNSLEQAQPEIDCDRVLAHNALAAKLFEGTDVEVTVLNHGVSKQFTFLYEDYVETLNSEKSSQLDEEIEDIRSIITDVFNSADNVLANSYFVKTQLQNFLDVESTVFYDDFKQFENKNVERENYFFSAQRLHWSKKIQYQLEVFAETGLPLKIAGKGGMEDFVKSYSDKYSNIEYLGYLDDDELEKHYNKCEAFVHTGLAEDCSNVVREAQSCGTPVIARNAGANPEICYSKKLLFEDRQEFKNILLSESFEHGERLEDYVEQFFLSGRAQQLF